MLQKINSGNSELMSIDLILKSNGAFTEKLRKRLWGDLVLAFNKMISKRNNITFVNRMISDNQWNLSYCFKLDIDYFNNNIKKETAIVKKKAIKPIKKAIKPIKKAIKKIKKV